MGILASILNPPRPQAQWAPTDDRWYTQDLSGFMTDGGQGGVAISADSILRCSTVLAAVQFRADSWAMCPVATFRKSGRGREEVPTHYSQRVLRRPNLWQTGYRWRGVNGVWIATWGNAYSEIKPKGSAWAGELWPLHPRHTRVVDQRADGSLLYVVREPGKVERRLGQERMLHFRGLSTDGVSGVEMYALIRNAVSIALLAEQHAATFLRKGARVAGLLVPTNGALSPDQRKELRDSVNADLGGASKTGTLGILPHGVELRQLSSTNRDGQVIELDDRAVGSILRFLKVPGVAVGWQGDKSSTYASAEAFFESGLRQTVQPLVESAEEEEEAALLPDTGEYQIKHNLDILLRVNTQKRYEAYAKACGGPFLTVNEVRETDDWNPHPDKRHDQILTPSNMSPELLSEEPTPEPAPRRRPAPRDDDDDAEAARLLPAPQAVVPPAPAAVADHGASLAKLRAFVEDAAARLVAFEEKKLAGADARNADALRAKALDVYGQRHVEHVAKALQVDEIAARAYCDARAMALMRGDEQARGVAVRLLVETALLIEEEVA